MIILSSLRMHRQQLGMTLVELLIAIAIMGLVVGGFTRIFITQRKAAVHVELVDAMTQQAQTALDLMMRELMTAGTNPLNIAFVPVTYSATQLDIRADLNGNGTTTDVNEHVIYTYDAATRRLLRDGGNGQEVVAESIVNFACQYLDINGANTVNSNAIRQVRVFVVARTAKVDPDYRLNGGYRTLTLTTSVALMAR